MRNSAAAKPPRTDTVGEAGIGSGGDGQYIPGGSATKKVKAKTRFAYDPAAELMPAAEFLGTDPDFSAILEDFRDSPFDPRSRSVLGRLMGVFAMDYQSARSQERAFLRRLLMARNAREGYVANRALHLCRAQNAIRRTLALGVAEARWSSGPITGFLGAVQARVAAATFLLLGPRARERVWDMLTLAGRDDAGGTIYGADPVIERALILKAIGARRHRLGPWSTEGDAALNEVQDFAETIRGLWRMSLAARTTLFPGDAQRTAKSIEHLASPERAGILARGDIDPIFAWQEHGQSALNERAASAAGVGGRAAAEVSAYDDLYEALPALDRSPLLDRTRLHQSMAEARAQLTTKLHPSTVLALADHLTGRQLTGTRVQDRDRALSIIIEQGFDIVSAKNLKAIREDARGLYKYDAAHGFGLLLSRYSGATYVARMFSDQLTAGIDPVAQIAWALGRGMGVPFLLKAVRNDNSQACVALYQREDLGMVILDIAHPPRFDLTELRGSQLKQPFLPRQFGERTRADTFFAPAALDLLAAPFGIPFPELGVHDIL